MTKKDFIDFAHSFGWTKKDAERALAVVTDPQTLKTELDMLRALARFAGGELADRQRLQAAQKGQATRNRNAREQLEVKVIATTRTYETKLEEERSHWRDIVEKIYRRLRKLGVQLDFIEELLNHKRG